MSGSVRWSVSRNSECNDEHHRRLSLVFFCLLSAKPLLAGTSVSGNVPGNVSGGESGPRKVAPPRLRSRILFQCSGCERECERDCECKCERV